MPSPWLVGAIETLRRAHGDGRRRRLMRVLAAMSGGVDSSVATALLQRAGHDVVGVTMRLWGGDSDTGCCSVSDVDNTRRSADALGVEHLVFNLDNEFDRHVVEPYVAAHGGGRTPNPCIECNEQVKFATFAEQARLLGFDAVATGHHARIGSDRLRPTATRARCGPGQGPELRGAHARSGRPRPHRVPGRRLRQVRGAPLSPPSSGCAPPTSPTVRTCASSVLSLAAGPSSSRRRIAMTPAHVVDTAGRPVSTVPAVELVTVGQRKGLGLPGGSTEALRPRGRHDDRPRSSWAPRTSCRTTDSLSSR